MFISIDLPPVLPSILVVSSSFPNVDMAAPPKSSNSETVMVVIRMRPFNKKEKSEGRGPCVSEAEYIILFPPT